MIDLSRYGLLKDPLMHENSVRLVPPWHSRGMPQKFYVCLPLAMNELNKQFCTYLPATDEQVEAVEAAKSLVSCHFPCFGVVAVTEDGARVVWRNEDSLTGMFERVVEGALRPVHESADFGSW